MLTAGRSQPGPAVVCTSGVASWWVMSLSEGRGGLHAFLLHRNIDAAAANMSMRSSSSQRRPLPQPLPLKGGFCHLRERRLCSRADSDRELPHPCKAFPREDRRRMACAFRLLVLTALIYLMSQTGVGAAEAEHSAPHLDGAELD